MSNSNESPVVDFKSTLDSIATGSTKDKLISKACEKVRELWFSKKYGFTASKKHAKELYDISSSALFQQFEKCVANPIYITLVRDGLRISYLNDEGRRKEIDEVKKEAYERYGMAAIRILNISSTGELQRVVEYLVDLKIRKNYNILDLTKEFEKILDNWEKITLFVKSDDGVDYVSEQIIHFIEQKHDLFFVFAYGYAIQHTIEAIAKLNNDGAFRSKYLWDAKKDLDKSNKEKYKCVFERISIF